LVDLLECAAFRKNKRFVRPVRNFFCESIVAGIVHQWENWFSGWMLFALIQSRLLLIVSAINGIDGVDGAVNWAAP